MYIITNQYIINSLCSCHTVCTGIASELALKWDLPWYCGCLSAGSGGRGVPRPAFLFLASLVSATSHFILAVSTSEVAFTLGVTLSGVAFGMVWPMMYVFLSVCLAGIALLSFSFLCSCPSQ